MIIDVLGLGTNAPSSFFHLNTTTTGSLFRTDGLSTNLNQWQLFTGTTEKFRLYIPANSSNVVLSTRNNGNMFIETGGNPRVRINNNLSTPIGTNYTTGHSRAGYMLLSTEPTASVMTTDAIGARSLLHLYGSLI